MDTAEQKLALKISGMHCAGCVANVERALGKVDSVSAANANLATGLASIQLDSDGVDINDLIDAVREAGYEAEFKQSEAERQPAFDEQQEQIRHYKKLMVWAWGITAPVMLVMAAHMVLGLMLPFQDLFLLLASIPVVFWIGAETHLSSWKVIRHGGTNMDVLISIGTLAAFSTGIAAFFAPIASFAAVSAMIICFHVTGRYLEFRARGRTSQAIRKLLSLEARTAVVMKEGSPPQEVPVEALEIGDLTLVKPGEKIPTDGVIVEGRSAVDESIATGESMPVGKVAGDEVLGSTMNGMGSLTVRVTRVGEDTFLSRVVKLVEECQGTKVPIQAFADRVITVFVPVIIVVALLTFVAWLLFPQAMREAAAIGASYLPWINLDMDNFSLAIFAAVAVLVIACPCALGLATPTALMVASGLGAQSGILIRNGAAIQSLQDINTVVLDKTGTVTEGKPKVTDFKVLTDIGEDEFWSLAASAEQRSEHPLAQAVLAGAEARGAALQEVRDFRALPGEGVACRINGKKVTVGRAAGLDKTVRADKVGQYIEQFEGEAKTAVVLSIDEKPVGVIAMADPVKSDSAEAVGALQGAGFSTVLLTGDNVPVANAVAREVGIERVVARVLPANKVGVIQELQQEGKIVLMIGDGINDAPALTQANVGMAIGTGTDIAIETSDVTLVSGNLTGVVKALKLSSATFRKIKQNLFWAFFYNVVMIPVALLGLLHPVMAEAAMAISSISVVANSLRLKMPE